MSFIYLNSVFDPARGNEEVLLSLDNEPAELHDSSSSMNSIESSLLKGSPNAPITDSSEAGSIVA